MNMTATTCGLLWEIEMLTGDEVRKLFAGALPFNRPGHVKGDDTREVMVDTLAELADKVTWLTGYVEGSAERIQRTRDAISSNVTYDMEQRHKLVARIEKLEQRVYRMEKVSTYASLVERIEKLEARE